MCKCKSFIDLPVVIYFGAMQYKMRAKCVDTVEWGLDKALISMYQIDPDLDYDIASEIEMKFQGVFPTRIAFDIIMDQKLLEQDFIGFNLQSDLFFYNSSS